LKPGTQTKEDPSARRLGSWANRYARLDGEETMESIKGLKSRPGEELVLQREAERAQARYLRTVHDLWTQGHYSTGAMDVSLRQCQARAQQYQQIMRMMVRPGAAPELRSI
jgi:hypothetical protein